MFNLVFFIVLTSMLLQGTSIPLVDRWLRVEAPMEWSVRATAISEGQSVSKTG